jgi:hypothetical protein
MYYDLIASLPHLPHFTKVERLPITPLRLEQRLRLLRPVHAEQLARAKALVHWRPQRLLGATDEGMVAQYVALVGIRLDPALREFVDFRVDQQTLLAALRRKEQGLGLPSGLAAWGAGSRVSSVREHFGEPEFSLNHFYPWLPKARERLLAGDAWGLEQLMMDVTWRWLDRLAEKGMFRFDAVVAYVFKWDLLQARLACDAGAAEARFRELIDQVTHVHQN